MKKTKTAMVAIAVIVAVVLVGGWAFAHRPWGARGYGHQGYGSGDPYSSLSPEQRQKLEAQEQKFTQDTAELRRELYRKRLELEGLWADPKVDPEKIKVKQGEVFEIERRIQEKALEHQLAIRELLPEEGTGYGMGYGHRRGRGHMRGSGHMKDYGGDHCM